jgi:uncharacterized iron-regulated membrane protein
MSATLNQQTHHHKTTALTKLKARRKLWLNVHVWLGLSLGFFLALIGLTGSVLVFHHEIDHALNSDLFEAAPNPSGSRKPLDEILATAKQAAPAGWNSAWLDAPIENGNYVFGFYYPEASAKRIEVESLNVVIDPYTAEVVGRRVFYHAWNPLKHCFTGFFFKLHYALFLGETGLTIVGVLAVFFFISVMTGLILWWPLTGNWKRVLTIKRKASVERFNHDLHQSAGFYTLIVMLALLVSGMYFNLPDQFRWLVERFSALTPAAEAATPAITGSAATPVESALKQAQNIYPGGTPHYYAFGDGDKAILTACYKDIPALRSKVLDMGCVAIDSQSGKILQINDPAHGTAGDVFMQWQWPLHSGLAFGWTGRILVFITGLMCPLLFVTGVIRWLQKRKVKTNKMFLPNHL